MIHWVEPSPQTPWTYILSKIVAAPDPPYASYGGVIGTAPGKGNPIAPPSGVTWAQYALIVNVLDYPPLGLDGTAIASDINNALGGDPAPAFVAMNEIGEGSSEGVTSNSLIETAAANIDPTYANLWGAYIEDETIQDGNDIGPFYPYNSAAIDAVYQYNGRLLPELYPNYFRYYSIASDDDDRNTWLNSNYFNGAGKLNWLLERQTEVYPESVSIVNPIFTATNSPFCNSYGYLDTDDTNCAKFIDRVLYVFYNYFYVQYCQTHDPQYRNLLSNTKNSGGFGSYLWINDTVSGHSCYGEPTDTTRDNWFANLWQLYANNGTGPNWEGDIPEPVATEESEYLLCPPS